MKRETTILCSVTLASLLAFMTSSCDVKQLLGKASGNQSSSKTSSPGSAVDYDALLPAQIGIILEPKNRVS